MSFRYNFQRNSRSYLNNEKRSNTMEALVPVLIFGVGIIISSTLAGLGIQRIEEGQKGK
jgi:hypothetical protein